MIQGEKSHKDSVERFDDFRHRKSRQNDGSRVQLNGVTELASLGAENWQFLTIFGAKNRAKMPILWAEILS